MAANSDVANRQITTTSPLSPTRAYTALLSIPSSADGDAERLHARQRAPHRRCNALRYPYRAVRTAMHSTARKRGGGAVLHSYPRMNAAQQVRSAGAARHDSMQRAAAGRAVLGARPRRRKQ